MKLNEGIKKGLLRLILAGSLFAGGITLSEKTGLTESFVKYNDALRYVYYRANEKFPYLVWAHYGNPYTESDGGRRFHLAKNRIIIDAAAGVAGLLGLGALELCLEERKYKRRFKK